MKRVAFYGDSVGAGLAAGARLELRDAGVGMLGAVVVWSPWADITETGDTYVTQKAAEPNHRYDLPPGPSADVHADRENQKHPYVSPVQGIFKQGFPPTLIQGGTGEILLSKFVRRYRALGAAGQSVTLDICEGMPHVFQVKAPQSTEPVTALNEMRAFLLLHPKTWYLAALVEKRNCMRAADS